MEKSKGKAEAEVKAKAKAKEKANAKARAKAKAREKIREKEKEKEKEKAKEKAKAKAKAKAKVKVSITSVPVRRRRTTPVLYVVLRSTGLQIAHRTDRGRTARRRQRLNSAGMNRLLELVRTRTVVTNTTDKTSLGKQAPPPSVRKRNDDSHT